jgi:hypothetical protein
MTRDVLISISGIQIAEGDNSTVEMITSGDYFLKNVNKSFRSGYYKTWKFQYSYDI